LQEARNILKKYWNFDDFRDVQGEIIETILAKKDTLALLPTGGGKSICYQVPGLVMEGVCLVISPLIALMEDQIRQLKANGIMAVTINASMGKREIDIALDNVVYGNIKFLYVSPERLKSELFQARFAKMKINLIAIDEAHCISEWGYDFRPSYLDIAALREIHPKVPFLALTATATEDVVEDIQKKLGFKSKNVIRKSFERKNLTYNTGKTINKLNRIEHFLLKNPSSGIIYNSTRKNVKELCLYLRERKISVDFYHAGLTYKERKTAQTLWMENKAKVIVATNAFGMGIDKPDVRFVLHADLPQSIEAYFQEAGRGGRDGLPSVANLYYTKQDIKNLQTKVAQKFPPIETIKMIYTALGNHFQLAYGTGKDEVFAVDLWLFSEKYNQNLIEVYNSLKFLELCNFIALSENYKMPSRIKMLGNNHEMYNYQVKNEDYNKVIQFILRSEMGVYEDYVTINEGKIAQKTELAEKEVKKILTYLDSVQLIHYIPRSDLPTITYLTERLTENNLSISPVFYHDRKKVTLKKMKSMIDFVETDVCKSEFLLRYFGESNTHPCGKCSSCVKNQQKNLEMSARIMEAIHELSEEANPVLIINLISYFSDLEENNLMENLRLLQDDQKIEIDRMGKTVWVVE
jgi:ATP-dependent DNA helicase RecQ